MTKTKKILVSVICIILAAVIASFGIFCVIKKETPVEAAKDIFTPNKEKIIGIWESEEHPGLTAYVFDDDGTYEYYISTAGFTGQYTLNGNNLKLTKTGSSLEVDYKVSISETTLTLITEADALGNEKEVTKFKKVEQLNQTSLTDMIGELKDNVTEE